MAAGVVVAVAMAITCDSENGKGKDNCSEIALFKCQMYLALFC